MQRFLLCVSAGMWFMFSASLGAAQDTDPSSDSLVTMVLDALRSNNQLINTAQLTVREILEDATAGKSQTLVNKLPDGGESRVVLSPRSEWEVKIVLRGDDIRVDRKAFGSRLTEGDETLACLRGVWTQYTPQHTAAWILRPEDLPGIFPFDPRQVGSIDIQHSLDALLRESRVVSAGVHGSIGQESVVRIEVVSRTGTTTTYEFTENAGFLPVRLMTHWPDKSIMQLVEFEYQDVLSGQARLVKKITRSFFARGVTQMPAKSGWRQRLTREVMGKVVINREFSDDLFRVNFPPGTWVNDNTRPAIYTASLMVPQNAAPRWPYTALLAAFLVILVVRRTRQRGWVLHRS